MKRLTVVFLLFVAFPQSSYGGLILRAFSGAETSQLLTTGSGSTGWVGNTLTLSWTTVSPRPQSWLDPDTLAQFLPSDAIGIHFEISADVIVNGVDVVVAKFRPEPFDSILSDGVHNANGFSTTDWFAAIAGVGIPQRIEDIPETTFNGVTSVDFFFANETLAAMLQPNLGDSILFTSGGPEDNQSPGSIVYGNVSWILEGSTGNTRSQSGVNPVPEPGSFILLGTGAVILFGCGWRRRRDRRGEEKAVGDERGSGVFSDP